MLRKALVATASVAGLALLFSAAVALFFAGFLAVAYLRWKMSRLGKKLAAERDQADGRERGEVIEGVAVRVDER